MKNRKMQLCFFEARKNFLSSWMLLFLVFLLMLNGWKLNTEYEHQTGNSPKAAASYEELYAKWKGTITAENISELMTIFSPLENGFRSMSLSHEPGSGMFTETEYDDYRFLSSNFKNEMEYDYLYINEAYEIVSQAKAVSDIAGDSPLGKREADIANRFSGRKIPSFADTRYIEVWQTHDFSSLLILLLCLFGLSPMFVSERETGMYMLQRTAKLGGSTTALGKLLTATGFVILVSVLFYAEDFLILQMLSGHTEALYSPVYAIRAMEQTPLNMTILQYILLSDGFNILGIWLFGLLILLLSCLLHEVLTVFFTGTAMMIFLVFLQTKSSTKPILQLWNPAEAVFIHRIAEKPQYLTILSQQIPMHIVLSLGLIAVAILLLVGIHLKNPGRRAL